MIQDMRDKGMIVEDSNAEPLDPEVLTAIAKATWRMRAGGPPVKKKQAPKRSK